MGLNVRAKTVNFYKKIGENIHDLELDSVLRHDNKSMIQKRNNLIIWISTKLKTFAFKRYH